MERVFTLLSRVSQTEQGGRLPSWLSTHPDPQQRLQRAEALLAKLPPGQGSTGYRRDAMLQEVEGVIYGPDPRQGFFRRGVFYQPELGIALEGPPGWKATNQRDAVVWQPRNGDAVFALTLSNAPSSRAAAEQFFSQQGIQQVGGWPGTTEGGLGGQFVVQTQQGPLAGGVTFVEDGNRVYRLIGYAQQGRFNSYANEIVRSVQSFRRVGSREVGRVEPWRVHVVSVSAPTSLDEIARRSASTVPLQKIALLNNVEPNTTFASGEKVKLVVGGVEGATVD
jgi:predicted Zn-dependent protease